MSTVGRPFPDKAIDLIDEAGATAAKTMMPVGDQEENVITLQSSSKNAVKEAIVCPNHVAQVGILFVMTVLIDEICLSCKF